MRRRFVRSDHLSGDRQPAPKADGSKSAAEIRGNHREIRIGRGSNGSTILIFRVTKLAAPHLAVAAMTPADALRAPGNAGLSGGPLCEDDHGARLSLG